MKLTVLIADDEPIARHALARLLREAPDIEITGEVGDGASALAAIRAQSPDLVFLDIQMPELSGLEVATMLGDRLPATVFVTAYEQHAVQAFEANALDYLVKPFSRARFAQTLQRARTRLSANEPQRIAEALEALRRREQWLERIPVRVDEHVVLVPVEDIVWIRANRNTVELHLPHITHELRETMTSLASRLDPRRFARVHRSAIVNIRRVQAIHPWFNGHHVLTLDTGQQLRMSRYQHELFLRLVTTGGSE
ncbi:MAG TPA: LytTR family DNA-binding domain-containing protein [Stenotrophomonas sp.]